MDGLKERLKNVEKDVDDLKNIWKTLSKIEKQNAVILSKFDEGHTCLHESEINSLKEFRENAKEDMKTSISRNQAIALIILAGIISFLLGAKV